MNDHDHDRANPPAEPRLYSAEWFGWVDWQNSGSDEWCDAVQEYYRLVRTTPQDQERIAAALATVSEKLKLELDLERAKAIAKEAHAGQVDKTGAPYIDHPLRVMYAQKAYAAKIVALLHDVVEDCPSWTFERLEAEGFSPTVITALRLVMKIVSEDYQDFVRRAARNPISKAVKLADLIDNMGLTRIADVTARDLERVEKYRRAVAFLASLNQAPRA
jgi:(p)ppGpp synthase/HD superfamily hydrolase